MTAVREPELATSLSFLGPDEPDHHAPDCSRTLRSGQLLRLLTRQLFAYRAGSVAPAPDLATEVPTVTNGGLSPDGRTYRLRLRRGVFWDAQGARELTAGDVVRGLKRVALPTAAHARGYFTATVGGMQDYCDEYDVRFAGRHRTAPDLAQFHVAHDIAGVRALDRETVEIRLIEPANDFLHILATGVAAAAPREYDYYLPDSPALHRNAPSVGPYRISRMLSRGRDLVLEPNPRWSPQTDPIRRRTADLIRVGPGIGEPDLAWRFTTLGWGEVEDVFPGPLGYGPGPYLAVNLDRSRRESPVARWAVRRALAVAIDKVAVWAAATAVPGVTAVIQHGLLPPGSPGYGGAEPLAADRGDPDRARQELVRAGYPDGLDLTLAVRPGDRNSRVVAVLRDGLARAGIRLDLRDRYGVTPWDLALESHIPDWYGNHPRTAVEPLVRGGTPPGSSNLGGYHNPVVDRLMNYALRDQDSIRAADLWRKVDAMVMADMPIVPILAHACGPCAAAAGAPPRVRWFAG
jgi:peptide/nickel transport system substrate-binding protein